MPGPRGGAQRVLHGHRGGFRPVSTATQVDLHHPAVPRAYNKLSDSPRNRDSPVLTLSKGGVWLADGRSFFLCAQGPAVHSDVCRVPGPSYCTALPPAAQPRGLDGAGQRRVSVDTVTGRKEARVVLQRRGFIGQGKGYRQTALSSRRCRNRGSSYAADCHPTPAPPQPHRVARS